MTLRARDTRQVALAVRAWASKPASSRPGTSPAVSISMRVIDRTDIPAWGAAVRDLTGGEGVDRVVETVGPATLEQSLIASARYGQIMLLITRGDGRPRIEIAGDAWARSLAAIRRLFVGNRADLEAMNRAVAAHRLRPVIDRVFAFEEAHAAYAHAQRGDLFGKVVIRGG